MDVNNKKKILYIITKGNFGGAQRYVYDLAIHLPKENFDVLVAMGDGEILNQKLKNEKIRTIKLINSQRDVNLIKDIKLFFEILRILKIERPDVIHLNSSKIGILGGLATRVYNLVYWFYPRMSASCRRPVGAIFTAHGFAFHESRPLIQKIAIKIISWLTIILSHKTILISRKEYEEIKPWPFLSNKLFLIYNGIEKKEFKNKSEAQKEISNILKIPDLFLKDKIIVGSIGELTKNKAHCLGLKAFKESKNIIWIIIGEGEERLKLEKIISTNNIHNVHLTGFIENASSLLKAFDIFLLPSTKEGLPYVLFEAGLAQIPIIATNVGGISEIITSENGILIPKENPDAIADAIKKLIVDENKRKNLGKNLKDFVEKNFSLEKMLSETLYIYLSL